MMIKKEGWQVLSPVKKWERWNIQLSRDWGIEPMALRTLVGLSNHYYSNNSSLLRRGLLGKREKLKRAGNAGKGKESLFPLPIVPRAPVSSLQPFRFPLFSFAGVY